ncbi:MAG: hypothetical protein Q4G23_11915, partial [Clostridia bacterium]|nr:hypothetical protein [Clostridia bacterium]
IIRYKKDMFVFSEVNKKSIALGKSILEKYPDSAVVYTGKTIYAEDEECGGIFGNRKIIYFSKDMLSVKFGFHSKKKEIRFFVIGEDEAKNVKQSLNVIELFKDRANTWAYVFSNKIEGEIILSSVDKNLLKLRRISDERTLIHSILQEKGEQLFKEALPIEGSKDKLISALVIGLSGCGAEMTKTLAWFGQMCNYKLEITAIDALCDAKDRIAAISPDLLKEEYNGNFTDDGEAQYKIDIKEGLTPGTASFYEEIEKIGKITYIFIDTGDDEENIGTAIQIRSRLTKNNMSPRIQAVVHDSERIKALKDVKNYSGQSYDIDFVGDVDSFYTVDNIMNSELEAEALARHMKWGSEDVFWNFEYNRRSSIASALHRRMKIACGVPGANKAVADRSEEEKINLRKLEHRRWNAYMRSEGYTFAEKRNNLAKTHNCLVTFDKLTREEQEKDDD